MRILQIIATLRIGGAEKVAKDIGWYALSNGHEVDYLVFGDNVGDYEEDLIAKGAKVIHIPSPSADYAKYFQTLKQLMRENRYDAVHAHTMFNIGWAMLAAKQCGVPIRIAHSHSALDNGSNTKKKVYETAMRRLILSCATDLVACGKAAGERLYGKEAFHKRGRLILNGIDTAAFAFDEEMRRKMRLELGLADSFVIGHAGHFMEVKNQSYLIRLLPEIKKRKPNVKLLLLGEGPDRPMLEQLIRELHLEDDVIMTGNVRNVPDYLSAMDVFALPSLFEGMPLSILEVQTNGLPCVLSERVPDDVKQTDLIQTVSLSEPNRWADAICAVSRSDPGTYAARMSDSGFDTKSVMRQFYQLYTAG